MEAFAPVLAERMELLVDYVPAGGLVLACDPERVRTRAEELASTSQEFLEASWVNAAAGGEAPIDLGRRLSSRSSGSAPRRPPSACRGGRSRRSG
jgi:Transcription-repair coupling factor (superfamily II helicase)